jgi:hypothetical protein
MTNNERPKTDNKPIGDRLGLQYHLKLILDKWKNAHYTDQCLDEIIDKCLEYPFPCKSTIIEDNEAAIAIDDKGTIRFMLPDMDDDAIVPNNCQVITALAVLLIHDEGFRKIINDKWVEITKCL